MDTMRLKFVDGEQRSEVLIKQEVEWLAEDTHAPDWANQELQADMENLRSIKTEEDPYGTDANAQGFTPVPQTDEYIKTELILDEEWIDKMNESAANCKQQVLADPQLVGAGISLNKSEAGELSAPCDATKRLRNADVRMLSKHLSEAQSINLGPPESIKSNPSSTFICKECGASFARKATLKKHMLYKHFDNAQERFECEICSRSFKSKWDLKVHLRTHSKDRRREFACDSCGKTFYEKNKLNSHKKIHAGDRYACKVCGASFVRKASLKTHMVRRQHFDKTQQFTPQSSNNDVASMKTELISNEDFIDEGNSSESVSNAVEAQQTVLAGDIKQQTGVDTAMDRVTCEVCHNSYPGELIKTHMRLAHNNKAYKCQICLQSCVTKWNLKMHLRNHSKNRAREFACEVCRKTYYNKSNLNTHKKVHASDLYSCRVCGHRFTEKGNLKRHMLSRQHFDKLQQFTPQSSNNDVASMKTELMSEEEFIDDRNGSESVSHAEGIQQAALAGDNKQPTGVDTAMDSVTCEVCHNSYPGELIKVHMRLTHKYKCQFCSRMYGKKTAFEKHLSTHSDNRHRPHTCEQCGFKFVSKAELKRHVITHRFKNRNPEHGCELCEKKFYSRTGLKNHMRIHIGKIVK